MKALFISTLLFAGSFTAKSQQNYDSMVSPLCSCDTVAYWRAYTQVEQHRNQILTDSLNYWRDRYRDQMSSQRSMYRAPTRDSIWRDGQYVDRHAYERRNFETWFMPGAGYTYYKPKASDSLGTFSGLAIEYLIYAQVEQNDNPGPSHVRFYGKLNLQNSTKEGVGQIFMYGLGLDLSLVKNPKRTFLVPYFGLEVGGLSNKNLGTTAQFTPILGIHLLSTKNLFINIHGGQVYTSKNIDMLQGMFAQATVNFSLW